MAVPRPRPLTSVHDVAVGDLLAKVLRELRHIRQYQRIAHEEMKGWGSATNPYFVVVEDPVP